MSRDLLKAEYETKEKELAKTLVKTSEEIDALEAECEALWNKKETMRRNLQAAGNVKNDIQGHVPDLQKTADEKKKHVNLGLNQYCPKCGAFVNGEVYCGKCGAKVN